MLFANTSIPASSANDILNHQIKKTAKTDSTMKPLNLLKCKIAASLGLTSLFTLSVAQAASITWGATGTFTDNTVLNLAGAISNEVYGVDFGGSSVQTTANGYTFADYGTSGNMSIAGGGFGLFGGYMSGGATTGDAALDSLLTYGLYGGSANTGTLNNLTVGQAYTVLVLLDDTRGASAGPSSTFTVTDGVTTSPSQVFEFANGSPSVGGYILGTFTANATTHGWRQLEFSSDDYWFGGGLG